LMKRTGMPNGLRAVGFTDADVSKLVEGTLPQHRVTKLAPRAAEPDELRQLFRGAMNYWLADQRRRRGHRRLRHHSAEPTGAGAAIAAGVGARQRVGPTGRGAGQADYG